MSGKLIYLTKEKENENEKKQEIVRANEIVPNLDTKYCFLILRTILHESEKEKWKRCHKSLRYFYPKLPIYIVDDNSLLEDPVPVEMENTFHYKPLIAVKSGPIAAYQYFLKEKWADSMILLSDSMFMKRPFFEKELFGLEAHGWKFFWEETTTIDTKRMGNIIRVLPQAESLLSRVSSEMAGTYGMFGIVKHAILQEIDEKYSILSIWSFIIRQPEDRKNAATLILHLLKDHGWKYTSPIFGRIEEYYGFPTVDFMTQIKNSEKYPFSIMTTF